MTLHELVLESPDIRSFLAELAVLAAAALSSPGNAVHCGVTILRRKRPQTVASSDPEADALDELQYGFGDGPCLTALHAGTTVLVPDVAAEQRWPGYLESAAAKGVAAILAVPLDLAGDAEAVLNIYSGSKNGFSADDVAAAETFTRQASGSLRLVLRITQLLEATDDLAAAMQSRTVIDMAVGAIMAENRCSRDEAFGILTRASSTRNMKLREVAAGVIRSISGEKQISTHFDP